MQGAFGGISKRVLWSVVGISMLSGCMGERVASLDDKTLSPVSQSDVSDVKLTVTVKNGPSIRVSAADIKSGKIEANRISDSKLILTTDQGNIEFLIPKKYTTADKEMVIPSGETGQGYAIRARDEKILISAGPERKVHVSGSHGSRSDMDAVGRIDIYRSETSKIRLHVSIFGNGIKEENPLKVVLDSPQSTQEVLVRSESEE